MLELMFMTLFVLVVKKWNLSLNFLMLCFSLSLLFICDDGVSLIKYSMLLLSVWLVLLMFMSVSENKSGNLFFIFFWVLFSLEISFYAKTMMFFYLGFEMSVIPVLLIILGWGYQPDRLEAGVYMLIYTVIFSLPLLIAIFMVDMSNIMNSNFLVLMMFIMAFLVKLPMFGVHLWLPRAHVEAPVYGSMILAGVMLKLGGYGVIKISYFLGDIIFSVGGFLMLFSILGGLLLSMICFTQSDMKMLVAYSSIVHMSLVLSGILTLKDFGMSGSILMMIGHGLCSSGLFYLVGCMYNRIKSRSMYINKGIFSIMPINSLWWGLFCVSNLSFPPCLNLPGELFLIMSMVSWSLWTCVVLGILGLVSSMYSIYLYSFTQHGSSVQVYSYFTFSLKDSLCLFIHWVPLNFLIFDLSIMI
uniref:NADH-ubiquinone oxidoreductase chain 4 n=1 Tax=Pachypsylla venusta TaxID=38123 RepID=Q69HC9_PACVE|nr:NADH dehydrogenase subunit 4 [Pachypsylla venusta]